MEPVIINDFANRADIFEYFQVEDDQNIDIIFATYEQSGYEGYALVVFEKDGKLYEVVGSHCSCYGLEDQWDPEETSLAALRSRNYSDMYGDSERQMLEALDAWEGRN